jgi:hypothetical protein
MFSSACDVSSPTGPTKLSLHGNIRIGDDTATSDSTDAGRHSDPDSAAGNTTRDESSRAADVFVDGDCHVVVGADRSTSGCADSYADDGCTWHRHVDIHSAFATGALKGQQPTSRHGAGVS